MLNLHNNAYDREVLKHNIYSVNLLDILKTQKLDVNFIVRYILNERYQLTLEEETINVKTVLLYQPHISSIELQNALKTYDSDDDSIEDFESYANK
jgi:hypothetical protein